MKNNREENFESVRHIVLVEDMNDGILEHAKFGKVGLNNCVSLLHSNILQKAHQWAHFRMKNYLGATLPGIFPFTCTRVANSTPIQIGSFHSDLRAWMSNMRYFKHQ